MHVPIIKLIFMYLPLLLFDILSNTYHLSLATSIFPKTFDLQMDIKNSEMPCKIRKRRLSFANNNLVHFLVEKSDSLRNEKGVSKLDRSFCEEDEPAAVTLPKPSTNADRFRNKSRSSSGRVSVPEVINPHNRQSCSFMEKYHSFGGTPLTYNAKPLEGKSRSYGEIGTVTKDHGQARSHVNKLIQEQRSNQAAHESEEQDKIRFAVKTISRELETERKLRRQAERMNKKLGRELANTKSSLAKAVKKVESDKQATEVLDQLCQKMASSMEEHRVELEELKKESERVRVEIEEERDMLRVADMLREERVRMKLIDAKHEYEDKHKQVNILARDLHELLETDNGIYHITPKVLSWYQSTDYKKVKNKNGNDIGKVVDDENALGKKARGLSWLENKGEVVNDEMTNTQNEVVVGRNSDCIEWEFGLDMKKDSGDLNGCLEERVLAFSGSSTMKEYEDEMERYKLIKDLRDRIVSGSDLS
ncbi:hypothetical protein L1987_03167 [Smallanthus sonchifolius]|uniref:Uncharacterized protein n=1 Tax=Smallanthus sonchifolius TaxID=185202 RepID=A0ACB9K9Y3_9ASTR|nr:hypothetical protein L1987_03167 [Smallanthus sonchifolius]